jgi:16S rRNA (guanine527-N7)-methyltransferase
VLGLTTRAFQERLARRARRASLAINPELQVQLERYFRLLAQWNEKMNLTAFRLQEPGEEALDRLLIEPLVAARHLPMGTTDSPISAIDIGSGSGSPAIPMRLAYGPMRLTLVEAKTRKAVFLLEATRALGLDGVSIETARFEQLLTRPELHEAFDVLTVRAVRVEVRTLLTLQAVLKPAGQLLWFRGPSGPAAPSEEVFPLRWTATYPLLDSLRSRLVVLTKGSHGARRGLAGA